MAKKYEKVVWLSKKEIVDFLNDEEIIGPLERITIKKKDGFFKGSAIVQTIDEAVKMANMKGYPIISTVYSSWNKGKAKCIYDFYDIKIS